MRHKPDSVQLTNLNKLMAKVDFPLPIRRHKCSDINSTFETILSTYPFYRVILLAL